MGFRQDWGVREAREQGAPHGEKSCPNESPLKRCSPPGGCPSAFKVYHVIFTKDNGAVGWSRPRASSPNGQRRHSGNLNVRARCSAFAGALLGKGPASKPGVDACACMWDCTHVLMGSAWSHVNAQQCVPVFLWHRDIPRWHCAPGRVRLCVCMHHVCREECVPAGGCHWELGEEGCV